MKNLSWFSSLKFIFSMILIALLISIFLYRTMHIGVDAEKITVQQMLNAINSHLQLRILTQDLPKNAFTPEELQCFNPLKNFEYYPVNYFGEIEHPDVSQIPVGDWYFDKTTCLLIYKVRFNLAFQTTLQGPARIRFVAKIEYTPPALGHRIQSIKLFPAEPYQWNT